MRRGFKTWAENFAVEQRRILHLAAEAPLPAKILGSHLDVTIISPAEIPGLPPNVLHHLLNGGSESWSATSFTRNNCTIIIQNTSHSVRRQESDLMHEMAHILCDHKPSHLVQSNYFSFPVRSYDPNQEEEAVWLGGCMQLPRTGLLWAIRRGMNNTMIAEHFGASIDLVRFRRQITGVDRQVVRR